MSGWVKEPMEVPAEGSPRFPDVTITLSGEDGNVFHIIGMVRRGLRDAGHREEAGQFSELAYECESYDSVLQLAMAWVDVQ